MSKRDLYVVAADRKDLYELLRKQFAGNDSVEIILDRRKAERRRGGGGVAPDTRRSHRRARADAYLRKTLGVVLVSVERDEPARPAAPPRAAAPARAAGPTKAAAARPARPARPAPPARAAHARRA